MRHQHEGMHELVWAWCHENGNSAYASHIEDIVPTIDDQRSGRSGALRT